MDKELEEVIDDAIAHYGKLGMRWGVRARTAARTSSAGYGPQPIMIGEKRGKPLISVGGRGHPATDEARRAVGLAQKAKKSGVQSLSNKELKELNERMNLEQSYRNLTAGQSAATTTKGQKFVKGLLKETGNVAKKQALAYTNQAIAKKLGIQTKKTK